MNEPQVKTPIRSFKDLEVYQNSYKAMILVMKDIIPKLPDSERFDLKDQLGRSCKAIPRLIAEGYAKRHQKMGFQKYIDDAMGECNETGVSLEQCLDLYGEYLDRNLCLELIRVYDQCGRQMYRLRQSWQNFRENH